MSYSKCLKSNTTTLFSIKQRYAKTTQGQIQLFLVRRETQFRNFPVKFQETVQKRQVLYNFSKNVLIFRSSTFHHSVSYNYKKLSLYKLLYKIVFLIKKSLLICHFLEPFLFETKVRQIFLMLSFWH